MKITLNGKEHSLDGACSMAQLLESLGLQDGMVAVERNMEIVPKEQRSQVMLAEGDIVEVLHFMGGGSVTARESQCRTF